MGGVLHSLCCSQLLDVSLRVYETDEPSGARKLPISGDFESWFLPSTDPGSVEATIDSYRRFDHTSPLWAVTEETFDISITDDELESLAISKDWSRVTISQLANLARSKRKL